MMWVIVGVCVSVVVCTCAGVLWVWLTMAGGDVGRGKGEKSGRAGKDELRRRWRDIVSGGGSDGGQ